MLAKENSRAFGELAVQMRGIAEETKSAKAAGIKSIFTDTLDRRHVMRLACAKSTPKATVKAVALNEKKRKMGLHAFPFI